MMSHRAGTSLWQTRALCCFALLFACLCVGLKLAHAADTVILTDAIDSYPLGRHLDYLEDATGQLTLHDILKNRASLVFTTSHKETPNFGFTPSVYWFRFQLQNESAVIPEWLLEIQYPPLDRIDVYCIYPDGELVSATGGDTQPFAQRAIKHRNVTFNIALARGQKVWVYLRVKTESSMQLPMVVWNARGLLVKDHEEQYALGIFYGILIGMFCYNLLIYLSIRDPSYLFYLCYLGGWLLFQMALNGLAFEYLWPHSPRWNNASLPCLLGFCLAGTIQFTRTFLQAKENLPRFDFLLRIYIGLFAVVMVGAFCVPYGIIIKFATVSALLTSLTIFVAGIVSLKRGIRQARYFMLAWSLLLFSAIIYTLKQFGVLPSIFITEYGMQIGSSLEVIFLSFALAHRMRILKEENERIQREATEMLEINVEKRTLELKDALHQLSEANEKLKALSFIDGLTGIKNRACFDEKLDIEWRRAQRSHRAIGLLMLDIDHFKTINDSCGHLAGDACLKEVAIAIQRAIRRSSDELFRYGGEEFAILLPETDLVGILHLGEAIRRDIEALEIVVDTQTIHVTLSAGAACIIPTLQTGSDKLIGAADGALYQAKRNGRNQVQAASQCEEV